MLVDMERSYITAGFFRYTMYRRFEASQSQAAVQKALNKQGKAKKGFLGIGGGSNNEAAGTDVAQPGDGALVPGGRGSASGASGSAMNVSSLANPNDYIAAHFDKKVNEESARQSLPVDGWRWQKRFFIFSGECAAGCRTAGGRRGMAASLAFVQQNSSAPQVPIHTRHAEHHVVDAALAAPSQ